MNSMIDSLSIGIRELMAVLIPGCIMCFFLLLSVKSYCYSIKIISGINENWVHGVAAFVAAYFIGYTIYVYSSFLDHLYDKIKRTALELDKGENATGKLKYVYPNEFKIKNWFLRRLFPYLHDTHNLIVKVVQYKNRDIGKDLDGPKHQIIDAYQYAFRRLMFENEIVFAEVESYFGTARFFRSMTLVLFVGTFILLIRQYPICYAIGIAIACVISFFVFLNRWRMANHVALKNLIILEGRKAQNEQND